MFDRSLVLCLLTLMVNLQSTQKKASCHRAAHPWQLDDDSMRAQLLLPCGGQWRSMQILRYQWINLATMILSSISRMDDVRQRDCQLYECLLKKRLNVFWSALFARDYGDLHAHTIERSGACEVCWQCDEFFSIFICATEQLTRISGSHLGELLNSSSRVHLWKLILCTRWISHHFHIFLIPPTSSSSALISKWIFCHAKIVRCIFHIVIVVVSHCTSKWVWGFKDIIKSVFLSLIYDLTWRCSSFSVVNCNCSLAGVILVFDKYLTSESEAQWECPWTMWKRKLHSVKEKKLSFVNDSRIFTRRKTSFSREN